MWVIIDAEDGFLIAGNFKTKAEAEQYIKDNKAAFPDTELDVICVG